MTAAVESEDQFIKVVVGKLKSEKDDDSQKEHTFEINVTGEHTLEELWFTLEENGYSPPDRLKQIGDGRLRDRHDIKSAFYPHTEFEIVSDKSAADETHIYINESLHAATSRDQDVKFDVQYDGQGQTFLKIDDGLELVFHRTVRMPDDDRLHSLPASVGTFPLYNTEDYADRLPENILEKGGLFLPMWQREALWIGLVRPAKFRYKESMNRIYAIRVYVGQINALTGKNMMEERGSQRDQDYLIFPGQSWIDGICVAPGVVRQFVAMPLGSGHTVEGQKTGEEKHGGLQIEIIPEYQRKAQKWLVATEEEALKNYGLYLDESKTPAELGLKPGAKVRVYPSPPTYGTPVEVGDLFRKKGKDTLGVAYLEAFYYDSLDLSDWGGALRGGEVSDDWGFLGIDKKARREVNGGMPHPTTDFLTTPTNYHDEDYDIPVDFCVRSAADHSSPRRPGQAVTDIPRPSKKMPPTSTKKGGPGRGRRKKILPSSKFGKPQPKVLNVKAMGLAAGGKLVQDIVADHNPPQTWNINAARLINIHILDPVSCESVTHIVPPPIPMSAYEAILAKLPFFVVSEQIDNRLEGGDFDNVKSVSKMDETKGIASEPSLDPNQPIMCSSCEKRLCDCVVRPCDHQFCNMCIRVVESAMESSGSSGARCPQCQEEISRVAGFSAPMNLPGEEAIRTKMPVRVLKIEDGRVKFQSIRQTRV